MKIRMAWASAAFIFAGIAVFSQPAPNDARIRSEIDSAYKSMVKTWAGVLGSDFVPPRIAYYAKPTKTGCGEAGLGNAFFCQADNAIYIDTGFIATVDKFASSETGSLGDYAGITVVAHEFGHAVERHTSYKVMPTSEAAADCFAGAETRQMKADGGMDEHSFDEALAFMEFGGDDKVLGIDPDSAQFIIAWFIYGGLNHGIVEQRQEAFLRGFYGGPTFCTDGLGPPRPPAGGSVLSFQSLVSRQLNPAGHGCFVFTGKDGVEMRNNSAQSGCVLNLLPQGTLLPDHVRIEVTLRLRPNAPKGLTSGAGIYYGDARSTGKLVRFADETRDIGGTAMFNLDGNPPVADPELSDLLLIRKGASAANGDLILTLDIHHEGKNVYFIEYLNGVAVNHNALWKHGTMYRRFATCQTRSDCGSTSQDRTRFSPIFA